MKKHILAMTFAALFGLSTQVNAHMIFSNWLIGATGGFSGQKSETTMDLSYTKTNSTYSGSLPTTQVYDFHGTGWMGGILLGYQQVCKRWLVGIEAEWDWQDIGIHESVVFSDNSALMGDPGFTWSQQVNIQSENAGSISARFGFVLDTLIPDVRIIPYARLGAEWTHQTLNIRVNPADRSLYPYASAYETSSWPLRFLGGIGFEFPIHLTGLSARVEYNYHSRGQSVENSQLITDSGIINPLFSTDINSQTNTGKVALVWNFL